MQTRLTPTDAAIFWGRKATSDVTGAIYPLDCSIFRHCDSFTIVKSVVRKLSSSLWMEYLKGALNARIKLLVIKYNY